MEQRLVFAADVLLAATIIGLRVDRSDILARMRSTLIRMEHENRRSLAVATGLGALLLCSALLRKDEPWSPRSHAAGFGSASRVAAGSAATAAGSVATRAQGTAPSGSDTRVDDVRKAKAMLVNAERYEAHGDYVGCIREMEPWAYGWPHYFYEEGNELEDLDAAIELKRDDCTRRVRLQADKAVRAKDYPAAIALLEPLAYHLAIGNHGTVTLEGGWLQSDLAVAYERNGQYADCIQALATMDLWDPEGGADRLFKAVDYNRDRCHKRLAAKYALRSGGCRISIDGAIATAAAPPALAPKGAAAACVALVQGKRPPNVTEDDPVVVCPVVTLVWKDAKGAVEREALPSEGDDVLDNDGLCGSLSSIAVGTMDGKGLVRVGGRTVAKNMSALDVFYQWNGEVLTSVLDLTY